MKYIIISIFFLIFLVWIIILLNFFLKKKTISKEKKEFLIKNFKRICVNIDKKHQIIDFDKLYHKILLEIWYKWTFSNILKLKPKQIWDLNKIWELHKLRNKLVHDFDLLEQTILNKKSRDYKIEVEKLLKKL